MICLCPVHETCLPAFKHEGRISKLSGGTAERVKTTDFPGEGGRHVSETRWEGSGDAALPGSLVSTATRPCRRGGFSISRVLRASYIGAWPELLTTPRGVFLLPVSPCGVMRMLDGGMPEASPPLPQNIGVRQARSTCSSMNTLLRCYKESLAPHD